MEKQLPTTFYPDAAYAKSRDALKMFIDERGSVYPPRDGWPGGAAPKDATEARRILEAREALQ